MPDSSVKRSVPPSGISVRTFRNRAGLALSADVGGRQDAQPVVLLHGGGQTRHSWRSIFMGLVSEGYRVINLDARGHGDSQWSPCGDYDLEDLGRDLLDVLGSLRKKPILIGASMGGLTALCALGLAGGDIAKSMILVDVVPGLDPAGSQRIVAFLQEHMDGFETLEAAADVVSAYDPDRIRPRDIGGLMKNLRRRDNGRLYWHWDPQFFIGSNLTDPTRLTAQLYAACSSISLPVLLIRGMRSNVVTDEGVAELRRHIPHLRVFEVPQAGHMITGDRNDVFNEGVLAFIRGGEEPPG